DLRNMMQHAVAVNNIERLISKRQIERRRLFDTFIRQRSKGKPHTRSLRRLISEIDPGKYSPASGDLFGIGSLAEADLQHLLSPKINSFKIRKNVRLE